MLWPFLILKAEKEDEKEMSKLLQLVLGCAVNCDQKQEYIQKIMGLEEKVQHSVMISIKEVIEFLCSAFLFLPIIFIYSLS